MAAGAEKFVMTLVAFILCVVLGIGSLAWGYAAQGLIDGARWLLLMGVLWLFAQWRGWKWYAPLALLVTIFAAAYGLWIELAFGWMVLGAVGGLLAWDLTDFSQRLNLASATDDVLGLERRHVARVGIVAGLGGILAIIAMAVHVRFSFEVVVGLVVLAVLGLTRLIATLKKD
jgi:hypothetical protein